MDSPFTGGPLKGAAPRRRRRLVALAAAFLLGCFLLSFFFFGARVFGGDSEPLHFPVPVAPHPDEFCPVGFPKGWKQDKGDTTCTECTMLTKARDVCHCYYPHLVCVLPCFVFSDRCGPSIVWALALRWPASTCRTNLKSRW